VADGNAARESALADMKGRWKRPVSGLKCYRQATKNFADLPDDATS